MAPEFSLIEQEIPNLPWSQVYIIGNYQNQTLIVKYTHASDNLPGGGVKPNESTFQAINREAKEALNNHIHHGEIGDFLMNQTRHLV